jgi:hypothetical protein
MVRAQYEFMIADTPESCSQVYRLRHDCYSRNGSIEVRPDGMFRDRYDDLPNHFSFLMRGAAHEPLATVRISVVRQAPGWTESPAQAVFGDHPALQAIARESYVEASRLCFALQARRDAFVALLGHKAALAQLCRAGWLVACPRIEHTAVYQKMFGFRPLAAPRKYFGVNFETQLLAIRASELSERVGNAKPMVNAWKAGLERIKQDFGPRLASFASV